MKEIVLPFILLSIFTPAFANVKFGELIQDPLEREEGYSPFSYNQYGIDTGIFQFPDDVKVLLSEKSKRIYHKPEHLPDGEDLKNYHTYDASKHWYWEKYPLEARRSQIAESDIGIPGRKLRFIPSTDEIIDSIIQKVGGEKNFIKLLSTGYRIENGIYSSDYQTPIIRLIGSEYRCKKPRLGTAQEYTSFAQHVINTTMYHSCQFEERKEMFLNTHNTRDFLVESGKDQEIIVKVFPVDPGKYKFNAASGGYGDYSPLMLIDPILDYYELQLGYMASTLYAEGEAIKQRERKQMQVGYRIEDQYFIGKKEALITQIVYPYYEIPVSLKKGQNHLTFEYYSYTPTDGKSFFIVE